MKTASGSTCAARLSAVSHRYSRAVALEDLNLDIPAGCTVGFIGPDGVGKSTLLALLAGVRKMQAGKIEVLGGDLGRRSHRVAMYPRVAYMPQGLGRNLYATLSVFENVDFFGRLFGYAKEERAARIAELLASTGLTPFAGRAAGHLSGGMKQKLALCCALIHDPDLLILDEPTTGVDPLSRRQFWELIARLRERRPGMSVLVATAYMDEATAFDWLVAMDSGRVLAEGRPGDLLARTGARSLEEAFIALLPPESRLGHRAVVVPPRPVSAESGLAIEAHDLTCRFGDFVAVDHVSFRIERGEIFGFVGSNGCGKTTTMKMLTGLLPASAGTARLFGREVTTADFEMRKRVGYMSQSFSLYTELTVRQNLALHARLFAWPAAQISARVRELVERFDLGDVIDTLAADLPLGLRQRLSLAVAVIHRPEVLILDEPTSGVDPVGRDRFWELLVHLSRSEGVTIFISTHFMNEAERCDRIALMHAGRVLACDSPAALRQASGKSALEEAFISALEEASAGEPAATPVFATSSAPSLNRIFSLRRMLAYLRRESLEIQRDPIRLAFALIGPLVLMLVFGYGITFDVENLDFAVLDRDQTAVSRTYLENFSGSRYFRERPALRSYDELERRLQSGELRLAIEIPPRFSADLKRGRSPEVAVWIDGAMPFRGETIRGYVAGVHAQSLAELARRGLGSETVAPATLALRFRYNQEFKSIYAMVPSVIALLLMFIPSVLTALGVVREKELGSITNLYATPVTRLEFLLGKQLPYIAIATLNFFTLVAVAVLVFGVPLKAGLAPLAFGALLYVTTTTGFGLVISAFTRTQIAALLGAGILTVMPAVQFCGMMVPVSSLEGTAAFIGRFYPTTYFMKISVGAFTKALGFGDLTADFLALAGFIPVLTLASLLLLKKQEA